MQRVEILEQKGHKFLWIDDELWMWDIPEEVASQQTVADKAYGNVLVAGYGLGVIQRCLLLNPKVEEVVTVEIDTDVLSECEKVYGSLAGVIICQDFLKFHSDTKYDCVVGDIWLEYGTARDVENYQAFKKHAQTLVKEEGFVLGWGQDFLEFLIRENDK